MKISTERLKTLIREELQRENKSKTIQEGLHPTERQIQEALYEYLVGKGLDSESAEILLSNIPILRLTKLLDIFRKKERNV